MFYGSVKLRKNYRFLLIFVYDVCDKNENRTEYIAYSLYLYFSGLSLRNISKALFRFVKRSHTEIRIGFQSTNLRVGKSLE